MMKNKKILLGVTGSIAAYKIAFLVRLLIKSGAEIKVIMTSAAAEFVSPLTLSTLSKNNVFTGLTDENTWANHVMLGRWADLMLIAPLSCNSLAKMANGICDNLLMAVYLSATCPVMVAPAMDEDMWQHPATKTNLSAIEAIGNKIIPVEYGELASGLTGEGRMAEPEMIMTYLQDFLFNNKELKGKKVLVTAGPTYEAIDPVRFISNHSSGKMGIALVDELAKKGAEVTLVLGPSSEQVPADTNIHVIRIQSAEEMFEVCKDIFEKTDLAILSAAVADYTPVTVASVKIKKETGSLNVELKKTRDILEYLGEVKKNGQVLVGFALETNNEKENAIKKLHRKKVDLMVLNSLKDEGAGFGHNSNKITIFDKEGNEYPFNKKSKQAVAVDIINTIIKLYYEQ